jgi:hydrogenase expression/formation protein HypC
VCLGIPGEVLTLDVERPGMATVNVGGARRQVNVMLIHVGFALAKIDEEEARLTLSYLEEMGQAYRDELQALAESRID